LQFVDDTMIFCDADMRQIWLSVVHFVLFLDGDGVAYQFGEV